MSADPGQINAVFCFGMPKSGTTYLQMILDAHPQVSCPSEHELGFLERRLDTIFAKYNAMLQVIDERTARQGPRPFTDADVTAVFRHVVTLALVRGAAGAPVAWYGLNDNAILDNRIKLYADLFPAARLIAIVRDPRSIAVSSWHHNHRVEPDFAARAGTLTDWSRGVAVTWAHTTRYLLSCRADPALAPRLHLMRYEDLRRAPARTLARLFGFLGVAQEPATLAAVDAATRFQPQSGNPFFRAGAIDGWRTELPAEAIAGIEAEAGPILSRLGYRPADPPPLT